MSDSQSMLCPECRKLISHYVDKCPHCGLENPARKKRFMNLIGGNRKSFVKAIITLNVIFFVVSYFLPIFIPSGAPMGRGMLGIPSPSNIALSLMGWADIRMVWNGEWWVLITAIFLHGGILHIVFNMMWVRDLAPQTEILFSPHKMIIIYILSGIGGNLLAIYTPLMARLLFSYQMPIAPVIGASGAVFGLMGGIIAFGKKRGGFFGRQVVRQFGMWALILIVMGFLIPGVSNSGHIGGFVTGFTIGYLIPLRDSSFTKKLYVFLGNAIILVCAFSFLRMSMRLVSSIGSM